MFGAWGEIIWDANPSFAYPFAFTGREYDPETGLYYYRARYYDSHTGRFISEDPLGFQAGDANLSRHVFNSPTHFTDPTGQAWSWPIAVIGGTIGAVGGVIGYGIGAWLNGEEITSQGATAAAAGGLAAGFIAGGTVGTAAGDPSSLLAAPAVGSFLGGAAGSALRHYITNHGTVDWTQVLMDAMFSMALNLLFVGGAGASGSAVRHAAAVAGPMGGVAGSTAPGTISRDPASGLTAFGAGVDAGGPGRGSSDDPPEPFREEFDKPADAMGDIHGIARKIGQDKTQQKNISDLGYTITEYYVDSNGVQHTVIKNPKSGKYAGRHQSSSN